jgi:dinuclear metal center YbgI/SA1388 family protein
MPLVADLIAFLERFAPLDLAEEWDNVGLLVGDSSQQAARVMTCLTLTPDVAREAIDQRAVLVVTHHPVLFRAVKRLTADEPQGKMLLDLIAAGIAVYSPHTAYDNAAEGINQQLAGLLGLEEIAPLRAVAEPPRCKIVCFVPNENLAAVQEAIWSAGAGVIGEYSKCSFVLDGEGSFLGSDAANPTVGQAGRLEHVAEARLEVVCPEALVPEALRRLRSAHHYEEPEYDVYPLRSESSKRGSGRIGTFRLDSGREATATRPVKLADLFNRVKSALKVSRLSCAGDPDCDVSRVGICCGSGGDLLSAAIAAGCDAFLTGEATFHKSLEARTAGIALILAGHYATERLGMEFLATRLSAEFPGLTAWASRNERDPIQ